MAAFSEPSTVESTEKKFKDPDQYATELASRAFDCSQEYSKSNNAEYLEKAISLLKMADRHATESHPKRPSIMHSYARRLLQRYKLQKNELDLQNAIALGRGSLRAADNQDPDRPMIMNGLSMILREAYKNNSQDIDRLMEAVMLTRDVIKNYSVNEHQKLSFMTGLATNLHLMYEATKSAKYLTEAIDYISQAVQMTADDHSMKPARLCNLGNYLAERYKLLNDFNDLERSLEYNRQASILIRKSTDQGNFLNIINSYSIRLRQYFERTDDRPSLDESIKLLEELTERTRGGHPMWTTHVNSLCNGLLARYDNDGNPEDLRSATENIQFAHSEILKSKDVEFLAPVLHTLCITIRSRYRITGAFSDLEEAVKQADQALEITPRGHVEYASAMQNKSSTFAMRFERFYRRPDLETAIFCGTEAARNTTQKDRQAVIYSNLGILYGTRFEHFGRNAKDLETAIEFCRKSIDLNILGFSSSVNLANWLISAYEFSRNTSSQESVLKQPNDLNEAIGLMEKAFKMAEKTPAHPDRSKVVLTLAQALETRYRSPRQHGGGKTEDRTRAKEILDLMMTDGNKSPPMDRMKVALNLADISSAEGNWVGLQKATATAVGLLPILSPRCVNQSDQQYHLSQFPGLASRAAASAIEIGCSAEEALRLLEQGRCVMSGHRFEQRVDISHLHHKHPTLSKKYEDLCYVLDSPQLSNMKEDTGASLSLSQRHRAEAALYSLIEEIQKEPGFENFPNMVKPNSLLSRSSLNAIAVINVSFRSGAFLIQEDQVRYLDLPGLATEDSVNEMTARFTAKFNAKSIYLDLYKELEWLWDTVVGPILDALGISNPYSGGEWPRVCWIPTGPLSRLPLHAAGYHHDQSQRTALDRVVSSYSPSIKFLQYTASNKLAQHTSAGPRHHRILIGSMARTPGMPSLPFARKEAKAVGQILQPKISINEIESPTQPYLVNELQHCTMFHFAGHGKADAVDPLRSALAVADGLVTVENLIHLKLNRNPPLLAYLSACLTGNTRVDGLVDEGVHLAASFLAAGFQNVIAALWKVGDSDSAQISRALYKELIGLEFTTNSIPLALHNALRTVRGTERVDHEQQRGFFRPATVDGRQFLNPYRSPAWIYYIHLGY